MAQRTCSLDGCSEPHRARGLCRRHYTLTHGMHDAVCVACGVGFKAYRAMGKFCSDACKSVTYVETMRRVSPLPPTHPVMLRIQAVVTQQERQQREQRKAAQQERLAAWRTARECPGCGAMFSPLRTSTMIVCSKRCQRRVHRRRRRASEVGAVGSFVWSDFMRIAYRFGFSCAYCGIRDSERTLEPDHVIPLSRGGYNTVANLLPACRACNGDKRDLLLGEWSEDRARRGLSPRITSWASEDKRYHHLTQALIAPAA